MRSPSDRSLISTCVLYFSVSWLRARVQFVVSSSILKELTGVVESVEETGVPLCYSFG